jgi:transcriptional regulator with XRE-family HTH domain
MPLKASAVPASEFAEQVRREVPAVGEAEAELRIVLARNVLRLRNRRGMTQRGLARASGVSHWRIAEIEGARASARIDTIGRLAAGVGVEPWTLLKRRPEPSRELAEAARVAELD